MFPAGKWRRDARISIFRLHFLAKNSPVYRLRLLTTVLLSLWGSGESIDEEKPQRRRAKIPRSCVVYAALKGSTRAASDEKEYEQIFHLMESKKTSENASASIYQSQSSEQRMHVAFTAYQDFSDVVGAKKSWRE